MCLAFACGEADPADMNTGADDGVTLTTAAAETGGSDDGGSDGPLLDAGDGVTSNGTDGDPVGE